MSLPFKNPFINCLTESKEIYTALRQDSENLLLSCVHSRK